MPLWENILKAMIDDTTFLWTLLFNDSRQHIVSTLTRSHVTLEMEYTAPCNDYVVMM